MMIVLSRVSRWVVLLICVLLGACGATEDRQLIDARARALFGESELLAAQHAEDRRGQVGDAVLLEVADLDRYLRYASENNASLRAAFEHWRAGMERIDQVTSLPEPVFRFHQFIEEVQTRTGPQRRRYSLAQRFPWFGTLDVRGDLAAARAEALWYRVESARLKVAQDVELAFHEYAFLARQVKISEQGLVLLKQIEPSAQRKIQGGGDQGDLLRLQVEIGKLDNEVASRKKLGPVLSARLAAAMHYTGGELLPFPVLGEPEVDPVATEGDRERAWLEQAVRDNPGLRELDQRMVGEERVLALAELQRWPDVTLGVDYIETGSASTPVSGSGTDPYGVNLAFELPIRSGKYTAAENEARRTRDAIGYQRASLRDKLEADVRLEAYRLGDAGRQIGLYRDSLMPRAKEALEVTRAGYRAGKRDLLAVIDSERVLLEFETSYWRACRDYLQSRARLRPLVGGVER